MITIDKHINVRKLFFLVFNLLFIVLYFNPFRTLFSLSLESELYSHILLIPFITVYLLHNNRMTIFNSVEYSFPVGLIIVILAIIIYAANLTQAGPFNDNDFLTFSILTAVVSWLGGFIFFFGLKTFRLALFPLFFLFFLIPIPVFIVDHFMSFLQTASAELSYGLIKLLNIPVYRENFVFHLTNVTVEVAKQCSGIRSSLVLVITGFLLCHFYLKSKSRRVLFLLFVIPVAVIKNSFRILTLSLLGNYVDVRFLTDSFLHSNGGVLFFILAIMLLMPILWFLRRGEEG